MTVRCTGYEPFGEHETNPLGEYYRSSSTPRVNGCGTCWTSTSPPELCEQAVRVAFTVALEV